MDKDNFDRFLNMAKQVTRNEMPSNQHATISITIALGSIAESLERIANHLDVEISGQSLEESVKIWGVIKED